MPRRRPTLLPSTVVALVASAGIATIGSTAAGARAKGDCPRHTGELVRKSGSVLWPGPYAGKTVLFGCTSFYGEGPKNSRLGPWKKGSRYAFDGSSAAWVIKGSGEQADRIYLADVAGRYTWLPGLSPVVGKGAKADGRVAKIAISADAAAWVTTKGTLVAAARGFEDAPEAVGAELEAARPVPSTSPVTGLPQGLLSPLTPKGKRLVIARYDAAGSALAKSLDVVIGQGEGDECGGVNPYTVTVEPVTGQRVGASWFTGWSSTSGPCG